MVEPLGGPHQVERSRRGGYRLGVVVVVGVVALLAGWVFGSFSGAPTSADVINGAQTEAESPTLSNLTPATTTTTSLASNTTDPGNGATSPLRGRVEVLPAANELSGPVALAVGGVSETGENLWVIQPGGRAVQRIDVPLRPGGFEHPMLIVGDYVLFTSPEGAYTLDLDLTEPAMKIAEESFLVPGSGTDKAWIVGCCEPQWFDSFDGTAGAVEGRTTIDAGFGWPLAGYRDGLLFQPNDTEIHGSVVYWPAGGTPEPLAFPLDPQSGIHTVAGDLAVLVAPGPLLSVVDLETGDTFATLPFESDEGNVTGVCFSPDQRYLSAVSSTGLLEVWELGSGATVGRMDPSSDLWSVGWAAPTELLFITDVKGESRLRAFHVDTLTTSDIARLSAPGIWRLATSGPVC